MTYRYFNLGVVRKAPSSTARNGLYARFLEIYDKKEDILLELSQLTEWKNSRTQFFRHPVNTAPVHMGAFLCQRSPQLHGLAKDKDKDNLFNVRNKGSGYQISRGRGS